jgi:hypothetical protein
MRTRTRARARVMLVVMGCTTRMMQRRITGVRVTIVEVVGVTAAGAAVLTIAGAAVWTAMDPILARRRAAGGRAAAAVPAVFVVVAVIMMTMSATMALVMIQMIRRRGVMVMTHLVHVSTRKGYCAIDRVSCMGYRRRALPLPLLARGRGWAVIRITVAMVAAMAMVKVMVTVMVTVMAKAMAMICRCTPPGLYWRETTKR